MNAPARRLAKWLARIAAVIVLTAGSYVAWDQATYNFGTVQRGRIYRSGQMTAPALARTLGEYGIKTVLNLRGPNPKLAWYPAEREATLAAGATQIDIPMSSCVWMSRIQLRAIIEALETADYPILIHCAWGSERTGLVAAFAELLRPGATVRDARAQFALGYLFLRVNDGKIMAEHLDRYEDWLKAQGLVHGVASFKRWVNEGFEPGIPNREQWPYDPYPLMVITRPPGWPVADPLASGAGAGAVRH
ncbi:MAG: tyrosine-protein phosphatase [Isosphaeraceae bacterium]